MCRENWCHRTMLTLHCLRILYLLKVDLSAMSDCYPLQDKIAGLKNFIATISPVIVVNSPLTALSWGNSGTPLCLYSILFLLL